MRINLVELYRGIVRTMLYTGRLLCRIGLG